jgi:hypothetical protein
MSQKSLPLTVEGFLERLKQEGFTYSPIHISLASRIYLLGDHVLWTSPQGHAYLIEEAEWQLAMKSGSRGKARWVASEMLYYEDGMERMLAEIRKRVTKVAVPEIESEQPARELSDWEKAWGYTKPVLRDDANREPVKAQAPWANIRMEVTNAGRITVTEEKPLVDFRKKDEDSR